MQIGKLPTVSKKQVYLAFFCLILALSTVPGGPKVPQLLWDLWRIAQDPVQANGFVERLDCGNHGHIDYSVQVGSKSVEGRRHNVTGTRCQDLKIGQRLAVYYERAMPENNYAFMNSGNGTNVMAEFWTGLGIWGTFVLLGPLFLALVWSLFSRVAHSFGS